MQTKGKCPHTLSIPVPATQLCAHHLQGVADRLTGQHLAHLLQQAGLDVSVEAVKRPEAALARKHAVTAALAQELSVFKKASGKQARDRCMTKGRW